MTIVISLSVKTVICCCCCFFRALQQTQLRLTSTMTYAMFDLLFKNPSHHTKVAPVEMSRIDIFSAAHEGNTEGVRRELAAGVDPNVFSKGQTVLMIASERGHSTICEMLVRNGAKINAIDRYGRTALYQAVVFNQPACAKVLVAHGAKQETRSWLGGESPLDIAKLRSNVELQRALANKADLEAIEPPKPLSQALASITPNAIPSQQQSSTVAPVSPPLAFSYPRRAPAAEVDETRRPEPLESASNAGI